MSPRLGKTVPSYGLPIYHNRSGWEEESARVDGGRKPGRHMPILEGDALANIRSRLVLALTLICGFEFQPEELIKCLKVSC